MFYADIVAHRTSGYYSLSLTVDASDMRSALMVVQAWAAGLSAVTDARVLVEGISSSKSRREYHSIVGTLPEGFRTFILGEA